MKLVKFKEVTRISVYFTNGAAQTFELDEGDEMKEGNGWLYIEYKSGRESTEINREVIAYLNKYKLKVPIEDEEAPKIVPNEDMSGGDLI